MQFPLRHRGIQVRGVVSEGMIVTSIEVVIVLLQEAIRLPSSEGPIY